MLVYLIVFLVSLVATVIFTYFKVSRDKEFRSFLKDPVADFLNASDEILKDEIALYSNLDKYPLDALIQTRNYFTRKKSLIESVSSMFGWCANQGWSLACSVCCVSDDCKVKQRQRFFLSINRRVRLDRNLFPLF